MDATRSRLKSRGGFRFRKQPLSQWNNNWHGDIGFACQSGWGGDKSVFNALVQIEVPKINTNFSCKQPPARLRKDDKYCWPMSGGLGTNWGVWNAALRVTAVICTPVLDTILQPYKPQLPRHSKLHKNCALLWWDGSTTRITHAISADCIQLVGKFVTTANCKVISPKSSVDISSYVER